MKRNRPIFSCPHCGGVLVFNDNSEIPVTRCPKCENDVSLEEVARHIFTKYYGFDMEVKNNA